MFWALNMVFHFIYLFIYLGCSFLNFPSALSPYGFENEKLK